MSYTVEFRSHTPNDPSRDEKADAFQIFLINRAMSALQDDPGIANAISLAGDLTIVTFRSSKNSTSTSPSGGSTQYSPTEHKLYLDLENMNGTFSDSFGSGPLSRTLERTMFHELIHGGTSVAQFAYDPFYHGQLIDGNPMAEQVAVFAENVIYNQRFPSAQTNVGERYGHSYVAPNAFTGNFGGANASGTAAFTWINTAAGVVMSADAAGVNFRATSQFGDIYVDKRYWTEGSSHMEHYATVTMHKGDGIFYANAGVVTATFGAAEVVGTLMGGGGVMAGMASAAAGVEDAYQAYVSTTAMVNQQDLLGISGEWYADRNGSVVLKTIGVGYNIDSGSHAGTFSPVDIPIHAEYATRGQILVGASGYGYSAHSNDKLFGSSHNDVLFTSNGQAAGNNVLHGNGGDDVLIGSTGADLLYGDAGNDIIISNGGNDVIDGGIGDDVVSYKALSDSITYGSTENSVAYDGGMDTLTGVEHVIGTTHNDVFYGGSGQEGASLHGGGGVDVFYIGGDDTFYGDGDDILSGALSESPILIDLVAGTVNENDFWNIRNFIGSDGDDAFLGTYNASSGLPGADIYGMKGLDFIEVGYGVNAYGGDDADYIKLVNAGFGIVDGGSGYDFLDATEMGATTLDLDSKTLTIGSRVVDVSTFEDFLLSPDSMTVGSAAFRTQADDGSFQDHHLMSGSAQEWTNPYGMTHANPQIMYELLI